MDCCTKSSASSTNFDWSPFFKPTRDLKAIKRIKKLNEDSLRDLCLFTLGINTAYRTTDPKRIKNGRVFSEIPKPKNGLSQFRLISRDRVRSP